MVPYSLQELQYPREVDRVLLLLKQRHMLRWHVALLAREDFSPASGLLRYLRVLSTKRLSAW